MVRCKYVLIRSLQPHQIATTNVHRRLEGGLQHLQLRLEGVWQIWKVFCYTLTRDISGFLGARVQKIVLNIGGALIFSRSID